MYSKGKFISIESIDGAGKTTQAKFLADYLSNLGYDVLLTRDPGGTPLAEKIREIILNEEMAVNTETLLFLACRTELIEKVIKPALNNGKVVISDRFHDSTYVYQGMIKNNYHLVGTLSPLMHGKYYPNYTLMLDLDIDESIRRLKLRESKKDRFELVSIDEKISIAKAYKSRAETYSGRVTTIDANGTIEEVQATIRDWVDNVFNKDNGHLIKV